MYSNSSLTCLKSFVKALTLNADTLRLIPKRNRLKFLTLHLPFCLFIRNILKLNGHPVYFEILLLMKHQIRFKMVHFNITKPRKNLELVNLKCATYTQPIPLSLSNC